MRNVSYNYIIYNQGHKIGEQFINLKFQNDQRIFFDSKIETFLGIEETRLIINGNNYLPLSAHTKKEYGQDKKIINITYMTPGKILVEENYYKEKCLWFTGKVYDKLQILFLLKNLYENLTSYNMKRLYIFIPEMFAIGQIIVKTSSANNCKLLKYYLWQPYYTICEYSKDDYSLIYYTDGKTVIERVS
ncbi:hypothetical protein Calkr_0740 [Caldicellulosiruptor acetigenus I77R1B]|uniref:Uncharacterized protein n=1 Tax=Caldicellulosiruptor acetigenus (strain ATCC 700853 / DSM 12137 / I77R1B) TaxID=632335 RepID=E4S3W7_CALA7|nr:hypothetical protein [Caldicellulosiruptor acetigenus]ADQ40266.1 hypothetical protein Calkr_0740 [Caldicellulosiruptor acetigenus I77R1B]